MRPERGEWLVSMFRGTPEQSTFVYAECNSRSTEFFITKDPSSRQNSSRRHSAPSRPDVSASGRQGRVADDSRGGVAGSRAEMKRRSIEDLFRYATNSAQVRFRETSISTRSLMSRENYKNDVDDRLNNQQQQQLDVIPEHDPISHAKELGKKEQILNDEEFLKFAKEFSKHNMYTPKVHDLLNPSQYSAYLAKLAHVDRLHGGGGGSVYSECSTTPSSASTVRSAAVATPNSADKCNLECHVVGDLLSFASNTMRLFDNPDLSDIIILVGESRFYAHKFALAAQSEVFRDMLMVNDQCSNCPDFHKELELDETSECQHVFMDFLRFFYCGRITFTSDTALPLLVLAAKYRVEALRSACDAYISGMIEDGDLKSAVRWLKYAGRYQLHDLTAKCVDGAISDNIEELVESPEWLSLSVECVEAIMKSSSLLVPDEFYMYEALQRWLMHQRKTETEDSMMDTMKSTLQFVRFAHMSGNQLLMVEESPIGLSYQHTIRNYLSDAYRFQILSKESSDFLDSQYLPRDYTNKQSCVQLVYHPTRNKKTASAFYGNGRWEIQPRRYYDTLNVVIILKKPLEYDVKVYISILIYKKNGHILMRLRRKACVLRALDQTPHTSMMISSGRTPSNRATSPQSPPANQQKSVVVLRGNTPSTPRGSDGRSSKDTSPNSNVTNAHRAPHGPASKLHGPHNGQEYYAIDNIISDSDFQMAMSHSGPSGLRLGVIIRTWRVNL